MSHTAIARDTRLSLQARAIAFWILDNPSEVINPDAIAKANNMTARQVKAYLAELAEYGHLKRPQKYRDAHGYFAYTPYTLPAAEATVTEPPPTVYTPTVCGESVNGRYTSTPYAVKVSTDGNAEPVKITVYRAEATVTEPPEPVTAEPDNTSHTYTRDAATRVKDLSLTAKDKGKRKREKKKDSGYAGDMPASNHPETPEPASVKVWNANHPAMQTAVVDAFKVKAGGFAGEIGKQLLGTSAKGQRREYAISPAMDPVEIVAFGQWYREMFYQPGKQCKAPTTAELLRDRVMQFRDDTARRARKLELAKGRLERLMRPNKKPDVPAVKDLAKLAAGDMVPVKEEEVEGLVKLGFMTADEMPRPTMKMINDRIAKKMERN